MKRPFAICSILSVASLAALTFSVDASAQQGFQLDRFNPSERGSEWFVLDTLDFRGDPRPAVGIVGEYANKPLVIYNADGSQRAVLVKNQFVLHPGISLNLLDSIRIGANIPISLVQNGDNGTLGGQAFNAPSRAAMGDIRVSADIRVLGRYASPFELALGAQGFIPSGEQSQYTGDGTAHAILHAIAAGELGIIAYSAMLGTNIRAIDEHFAGAPIGSDMIFGLAGGVRLMNHNLLLGPELYGATNISHNGFAANTTPLELLLGGHLTFADDWRVGAGAGPGLNHGIGAPAFRIVGSIEWVPAYHAPEKPPVVGDCDKDGIPDNRDACPCSAGPASSSPASHGCPPLVAKAPSDRDGDGIPDDQDACPDTPGVKTDDPKTNGCPPKPADRDGDGIIDAEDACPDTPGVRTNDPKTNGCPPDPDRDKDGIKNEDDACPDEAGPPDPDPKKNGCPKAVVRGTEIKIMEQVKFKTGSAQILPDSDALLTAVKNILTDHPEIKLVRVEGHTDNVGGAAYNMNLSTARAASVVKWLVAHGIDKSRLKSQGFGMTKPIDDNKTDAGRTNNRRVEFHIESGNPAPANP